ncbi:hypothetical protein BDZ89DRAFT_1091790 [Hymenopellis radicata]|nr:hypothetical protein BDZ89DRAFT_1091790 [Hymenopellis radicata]
MTRTARAVFPKAMIKDRSESRSGLDKSLRKNGGGQHNWGSLADERDLEFAALDDEAMDMQKEETDVDADTATTDSNKPAVARSASYMSDQELETAKEFRKNVFKGEVDLAAIARTSSAVSTSPPDHKTIVTPVTQVHHCDSLALSQSRQIECR